jgi:mRNA interferase HigB
MRIIKPGTIRNYWHRHPTAQASLEEWLVRTRAGQWNNIIDLRKTFPSADSVMAASGRPVMVFNIAGNRYRLVTAIHFNTKLVYVLLFLTHAEYSQGTWKDHL